MASNSTKTAHGLHPASELAPGTKVIGVVRRGLIESGIPGQRQRKMIKVFSEEHGLNLVRFVTLSGIEGISALAAVVSEHWPVSALVSDNAGSVMALSSQDRADFPRLLQM
jgi:hypothetical protein